MEFWQFAIAHWRAQDGCRKPRRLPNNSGGPQRIPSNYVEPCAYRCLSVFVCDLASEVTEIAASLI
eukprot:15458463-Alexandrium_andersonii.AAC.1